MTTTTQVHARTPPAGGGWFATTHWSVVLTAAAGVSPDAHEALEKLCQAYWYPLYAYARRSGHEPPEAEDLTQEFFFRLLRRKDLAAVNPELGRFRSFLLASFKHFMADEWRRGMAAKRGGGQSMISLDGDPPEASYRLEPGDTATPETLYER